MESKCKQDGIVSKGGDPKMAGFLLFALKPCQKGTHSYDLGGPLHCQTQERLARAKAEPLFKAFVARTLFATQSTASMGEMTAI